MEERERKYFFLLLIYMDIDMIDVFVHKNLVRQWISYNFKTYFSTIMLGISVL